MTGYIQELPNEPVMTANPLSFDSAYFWQSRGSEEHHRAVALLQLQDVGWRPTVGGTKHIDLTAN